jgi:hypothetical protein
VDPNPAASIDRDSSGQAWFPPEKKAGPTTWGQKPELQEAMGMVIEREHDPQSSSVILGGPLPPDKNAECNCAATPSRVGFGAEESIFTE